jgi:hypothetical protein
VIGSAIPAFFRSSLRRERGEVSEAVGLRQTPFAGMPVSGYLAMIKVAFYGRAIVSG